MNSTEPRISQRISVAICVCTYMRPDMLAQLLPRLIEQAKSIPNISARVIVIDNDPAETARDVVHKLSSQSSAIPVKYVVCPAPGVGNARNKAFSEIRNLETLIFFDDDQLPENQWLSVMIARHREHPDDILVGPVIPVLPAGAPEWSEGAWAWGRRVYPDGALRKNAGFGNILLSVKALQSPHCRVPSELGVGMGEDTVVTTRLVKDGFVLRQAAGAIAYEEVPGGRLTVEWVTARFYASGRAWVHIQKLNGETKGRIYLSLVKQAMKAALIFGFSMVSRRPTERVQAKAQLATVRGYINGLISTGIA